MAVHAPGRVVLGGLDRPRTGAARALARALASSAPRSGDRKPLVAGLSMTSMIDVLVVLTVFLLLTFSASDECLRRPHDLPPATEVSELMDAPLIDVAVDSVFLDGAVVVTQGEISGLTQRGQVARLDGLFNALAAKHALSKQLSPGREPPTHVILAIDSSVPAAVVKSVVMTAARSGYPSIDFMVHSAPKG